MYMPIAQLLRLNCLFTGSWRKRRPSSACKNWPSKVDNIKTQQLVKYCYNTGIVYLSHALKKSQIVSNCVFFQPESLLPWQPGHRREGGDGSCVGPAGHQPEDCHVMITGRKCANHFCLLNPQTDIIHSSYTNYIKWRTAPKNFIINLCIRYSFLGIGE